MTKRMFQVLIIGVCVLLAWKFVNSNSESEEVQRQVESKVNQTVMTEELNHNLDRTNINKFIEAVNTNTEIIVMRETGTANISYSDYDANWNKWLTHSDIKLDLNYLAVVSIPTSSIKLNLVNDVLYASYIPESFNVVALEITDKYIMHDRGVFGRSFTDDEKIAMETKIKDELRKTMLSDEAIISYTQSLESYLYKLADSFHVDLIIK